MTDSDLADLQPWLARRHGVAFTPDASPAQLLAATLDLAPAAQAAGDALPPMWQVVYGHEPVPSAALGEDGAPPRDGTDAAPLMPPIALPQVMWAGADYTFHKPLRIGQPVQRHSRVESLTLKQGRRGPMVFVTWRHEWQQALNTATDTDTDTQTAITELYHAVYLGADQPSAASRTGAGGAGGSPAAAQAAAAPAARTLAWPMSEVRLFRYSALTFNAHRIHYDRPYATDVAGYPGLVVHGPLQALLIAETWRRWHPQRRLVRASYQARAPLFGVSPVAVSSSSAAPDADGQQTLWSHGADGQPAMRATLTAAD